MVKWNPELDLILIQEIIKANNVTVGKDLRAKIADMIGDGCTPKAVENRISTLKILKGRASGSNAPPNTPAKSIATTPGKSTTKGTGKASTKKGLFAPNDAPADTDFPTKGASQRRAGGKRKTYAEPESSDDAEEGMDGGPVGKKVKTEPKDEDDDLSFEGGGNGSVDDEA